MSSVMQLEDPSHERRAEELARSHPADRWTGSRPVSWRASRAWRTGGPLPPPFSTVRSVARRWSRSFGESSDVRTRASKLHPTAYEDAAQSGSGRRRRHWHDARDRGATPHHRSNVDPAAKCIQSVSHALQSRAIADRRSVEPDAVVFYLEGELAADVRQADDRARGQRVLRNVLQGLEAREVDGRLHLLRDTSDPVGHQIDR